jgi:hypothetical protein
MRAFHFIWQKLAGGRAHPKFQGQQRRIL